MGGRRGVANWAAVVKRRTHHNHQSDMCCHAGAQAGLVRVDVLLYLNHVPGSGDRAGHLYRPGTHDRDL